MTRNMLPLSIGIVIALIGFAPRAIAQEPTPTATPMPCSETEFIHTYWYDGTFHFAGETAKPDYEGLLFDGRLGNDPRYVSNIYLYPKSHNQMLVVSEGTFRGICKGVDEEVQTALLIRTARQKFESSWLILSVTAYDCRDGTCDPVARNDFLERLIPLLLVILLVVVTFAVRNSRKTSQKAVPTPTLAYRRR